MSLEREGIWGSEGGLGPSRQRWGWGGVAQRLLADVDPLGDAALLAQHVAAPVEAAVAALAARLLQDVVSPAAAQRPAAVHAAAGLVADAALSAQ